MRHGYGIKVRKLVVTLTLILFICGTIGSNIGPALVDEHPVFVLLLSARNRNLFGSVPFIDGLPYFVIGFVRLMLAAMALFFVGRWYGNRALNWVSGQVNEMPAIYRWTERATARAGWLAILLMPGSNIVCLLLGHHRMEPRRFAALASAGVVLKLVLLFVGGHIFEDQIRSVLSFIESYQWWIVIGLFAITIAQSARRKSPGSPEELAP